MQCQCCPFQRGQKTLVKIVIANPTHVGFLDLAFFTQGFATSKVAETKEQSYKITTLQNHFLSLAIEIFDYLHQQSNIFYNFVPTMRGPKSPLFSVLTTFFR